MAGRQVRTLVVPESAAGQRLETWLVSNLRHLPAERIPDLIARGAVWTGKHRCQDPAYPVVAGETVLVCFPLTGKYDEPQFQAAQILFEGDGLLVVEKPSGWYSQETPWDLHGNLLASVKAFLVRRDGQLGFLHLVNRLDRETSGIIILARRKELASPLQAAWSSGQVDKRYWAIVTGHWDEERLIDAPIGPAGRARFHVHPNGKTAQTRFRPLGYGEGWTLVEAAPLTGRTHQIRVHAAHQGHALIGDTRYGGKVDARIPHEFFLHAHQLQLTLQGRSYQWQSRLPEAMGAYLAESPEALAAVGQR